MKKIITITVILLITMALFVGCAAPAQAPSAQAPASEAPASDAPASDAPASDAPASEAPASEVPAKDGGAEVVNPITIYDDVDAMAKETGITVRLPRNSQDIVACSISKIVDDVTFSVDGVTYNYRKAPGDYDVENLSGMYVEWTSVKDVKTPGGIDVVVKTDSKAPQMGVVEWKNDKYKYTMYVETGFEEGTVLAAVDSVMTSDV